MNAMGAYLETAKLELIPTFEPRADFVADATRDLVDLSFPGGLDGFALEARSWRVGEVCVNDGIASGLAYRSDPLRHRQQEVVQLNCLGFGRPRPRNASEGRMTLLGIGGESANPGAMAISIDVFVPFEKLGFDPGRVPEMTLLPFGHPVGRVLNTAMADVTRRQPHVSMADGLQMVDNLCALVRDLLLSNRAHANRENIALAKRLAMDRYIEDELSADLSAHHLARVFAMSRTSLFRMFETDGGVDAYVRKRRLHQAFHGLRAAEPGKGAVRQVAEGLGFFEAANLTRAFRREFGFPPSELGGAGLPGANGSEDDGLGQG